MMDPDRVRRAVALAVLSASLGACGETTISITDPPAMDAGPPPLDLERGLLAYLPLDETEAGMPALDASGHGHDGTPSATPPTPSLSVPPTGLVNPRSLSFSGDAQYLDLGNPPTLDIAGSMTISAWVRLSSLEGFQNIVAHGWHHDPDEEVALRVQGVGVVPLEAGGVEEPAYEFVAWEGVDHRVRFTVPAGDVDSWHHLCGVYDGDVYRLYRDGERVAEERDTFAPTQVGAAWGVGGRVGELDIDRRYLNGMIDEVRIYERALSDEEVRALFKR
jgi:hypothetical protein